MIKTYFTFGTASHFPYGIKDYVVIEAINEESSLREFMNRFPGPHSDTLNCAFYYSEDEWSREKIGEKYYKDLDPVEYIVVKPTREDIRDLVTQFVYMSSNAFVLKDRLRNALSLGGKDLDNLINTNELTNVDHIMDKLEENGYLEQIEKESNDGKDQNDDTSDFIVSDFVSYITESDLER